MLHIVVFEFIYRRLEKQRRQKMLTLLILILISIVFWGLFFQIFLVANLFIDRNVDRVIFGHLVPPVAFISLESIFIFYSQPTVCHFMATFVSKRKYVFPEVYNLA